MKMPDLDVIRISVRNLVEFIFRSGDIDNRRTGAKEKQAMEAGSRLHRKIQRQMGSTYESEVSLKQMVERKNFRIQIEGRADGIFHEKTRDFLEKVSQAEELEAEDAVFFDWWSPQEQSQIGISDGMDTEDTSHMEKFPAQLYIVDEIKGVYRNLRKLKAPVPVHKAQAMCYAYIFALQNQKEWMGIQMTYCHLETEEIRRFYQIYTFQELEEWFQGLMKEYERWAEFQTECRRQMLASLDGMEFPFPYRPGQRKLAVSVYRSIERKGELFIQAPTGIGKTMSVLFPALKAMGQGMGDRFFYLTAKTITRTVAEEALEILRKQGLRLHSVTITAKEKLCPMEQCQCNPENCPRAKGHFDRVNDALYDMLTHEEAMLRENIQEYAEKYQVCPFEFNLDLTLWSQGIICDYNYVFDPNVYLRRFFGENAQGNYIFLVDEAHNLPERAREMFSAALVKEEVLKTEKWFRELASSELDTTEALYAAKKAARALKNLNKKMLSLKKETVKVQKLDTVEELYQTTQQIQDYMSTFLEETGGPTEEEVLLFYFELRHFNATVEMMDNNYVPYCSVEGGEFQVKLLCANPAVNIQICTQRSISTVFFSATLLPMRYYRELLTTEDDAYAIYVDSPFDNSRRLLAISEDVTSRYTMRTPAQYNRILDYIVKTVAARTGNYMVFFPSYQFMMEVIEIFTTRYGEDTPFSLVYQHQGMAESDRDAFLQEFRESDANKADNPNNANDLNDTNNADSLVGFCVIGGIFSEGIDLTGEQLIGVLVVGTGLAQISTEGELLREYFEEQGKNGYDYAYRFPGINRVFQAAGRVIRTTEDTGVVVLLDNRMLQENHVKLFPMDWENYREVNLRSMEKELKNFWKGE